MIIAASVSSGVGRADAVAPRWLGLVVIVIFGAATFGALLLAIWAGGYVAFAGSSLRGKALVAIGTGVAVLAGIAVAVLLPRLKSDYGGTASRCLDGVFWWIHYPNRRNELSSHPDRFCWSSGGGEAVDSAGGGSAGDVAGALIAVAGSAAVALIIAAVVVAIVVRRSRGRVRAPAEEPNAVVLALDESLDDLRREPDVRRAIIACYARMERAFARDGRGRRGHEAPLEFLARVLERVAREPGEVLTELFECARFSVEPLGEQDKRNAIAALEALRAETAAG